MKYTDEVQFCFGIALVNDIGTRLEPFEYTGRKVVLHSTFEKLVKEEIKRVKSLTGNCPPWVVNQRPEGAIYLDDPVDKVKGIGNKKKEQLKKVGILTVADLVRTMQPPDGFTAKSFSTLKSKLPNNIPPTAPSPIDHRKYENPYLSLYGDE